MTQTALEIDPEEVLLFIRAEGFYPIEAVKGIPLEKQAQDQAMINPGTLRVEDRRGKILWRQQ